MNFEYKIMRLEVLTKGIFSIIIMSVEEQDNVLKTNIFVCMVITLRTRKKCPYKKNKVVNDYETVDYEEY